MSTSIWDKVIPRNAIAFTDRPKVFIGAPVRDRGWVLQRYLDAVKGQRGIDATYHFIVNDCTDDTEAILKRNHMDYSHFDLGKTYGSVRGEYSMNNLARLRNKLLERFMESECDWLFSIDTDIILQSNKDLLTLLSSGKDIIAGLIRNHPTIMAHNALDFSGHWQVIPANSILPCEITGAVYLIHRSVIEQGVRYGNHQNGEDIAFCQNATRAGFDMFVDTSVMPIHAYAPGVDLKAEVKERE